jgi:DNA-directed RNA polymerase specialized sigma24 family protein
VTFEQLILQQRPHLERLVQEIARRYHLASTDVQEFRIALDQALERNNYELLRAFDGRSTWETYLRTVVTRQYYLYQTSLWGSWRPSERATRIGAAAVLLEELVLRDRFALPDAIDWMRTTHRVDEPRHKLMRMAAQLGISTDASVSSLVPVPESVPDAELRRALRQALALVSAEDRLLLELRFRDGQPLTRIAALLRVDARPLQRRIDAVRLRVREPLLAQGVDAASADLLLSGGEVGVRSAQPWWNLVLARPSKGSKS